MARQSFEQWLAAVDAVLVAWLGLSHDDLPDCCYRDWYDDGLPPAQAAKRAVKQSD